MWKHSEAANRAIQLVDSRAATPHRKMVQISRLEGLADAHAHPSSSVRTRCACHGAHAGAEHDLFGLARYLSGAHGGIDLVGWHRARLHDLPALRDGGNHCD